MRHFLFTFLTISALAVAAPSSNRELTGTKIKNGSGTVNIPSSGTWTIPSVTDQAVGRATTDTLTNKTLTSPAINGANLNFGTASDTNRVLLPTDSTTNLANLTNTAGLLAYDSSQGKPVFNDGTGWTAVGSSSGSSSLSVASKSTTYTASTSDDFILADTSGGAWTLTLYAATGHSGKVLRIKKTDSSTNALTVDADSSETIDGNLTFKMAGQYQELALASDGSNWQIIGFEPAAKIISVTSSTKTPSGSNFHALTGNSLALSAGTYIMSGQCKFSNGGVSPTYSDARCFWSDANGADTASKPTDLSIGYSVGAGEYSSGAISSGIFLNAPNSIVRCTSSCTVYLDVYSAQSTAANARITVYANALRLQ